MPNIFPKRQLQTRDVLDPNDMNEDLGPIQSTVAGNLDMENIMGELGSRGTKAENFKDATTAAPEAYYRLHSAVGSSTHPPFLEGTLDSGEEGVVHPTFDPDDPAEGVFVVPDNNQWVPIDRLDVEFTAAGASNLWINAIAQYSRNGWQFLERPVSVDRERTVNVGKRPSQAGLNHRSNGFFPARLQFAIRINGRVLEWTVTGKNDIHETDSIGIRPVESLAEGADTGKKRLPGITVPNTRIASLGPEMLPIRLGTFFPVEPGTYKVEVVARRIPARKTENMTKTDVIGIFGRELHVLELFVHPAQIRETKVKTALVPRLRSGTRLGRVGEIVNETVEQCNELAEGNIKRESLFHTQLPSKVVRCVQDTLDSPLGSSVAITNHWPGWNQNIVTTDSSGFGWFHLSRLGNKLEVTSGETFFDDDIIILMANITLVGLEPRSNKPVGPGSSVGNFFPERFLDYFGAFSFGIRESGISAGGVTPWRVKDGPGPHVYANSFNFCSFHAGFSNASSTSTTKAAEDYFGIEHPERVNIPLFTVMRGSDFKSGPGYIHHIGVFAASMAVMEDGFGVGPKYKGKLELHNPKLKYGASNLIMIHLRK